MYIKPVYENKTVSGLPQVRPLPNQLPAHPYQLDHKMPGSLPPVYNDNTSNPRDILAAIWRGKWIFLATVFTFMLLAVLFVTTATPKYSPRSLLMIEDGQQAKLTLNSTLQTIQIDDTTLFNDIVVLRSHPLGEEVFDALQLESNPDFNPALNTEESGIEAKLSKFLPDFLVPDKKESVITPAQKRAKMIGDFIEGLHVIRLNESRVLELKYTATDPELATTIVNTYADTFINQQIESKFNFASQTNDWLDTRVNELRKKVKEDETAIEEYRQSHGLLQTATGATVYTQQLSEINTQLVIAGTVRAEKEARLSQARALGSAEIDSASEIIGSELIRRLREQESTIARKLSELSTTYGTKHPSVVNIIDEKQDIRNKIASEARKIIKGLENEATIARSREAALRSRLRTLESQLADSNTQSVKLRALEREAEASRNRLNTFLARYNENGSQNAKVVSYATTPTEPSFPMVGQTLGLVLFGSILLGLVNIFIKELFDKGFHSGVQIEQHTGLPSLGMVPVISRLQTCLGKPESYVLKYPSSEFSEAIRSVYTNMLFTRHDGRAPRVVQFTSAYPGEGKSTIARCLAILKRQAGVKTIIIDANIREPTLHKSFNTPKQPGLAEYLSGLATVHEIITKDKKSGTYLITAGETKRSPTDILPSRRIDDLFEDLSEDFDLIIVDSPPVLSVPDARILASRVDMSVVVIKWADTREQVVDYALKQLSEAGAPRLSTVLAMVDTKKHAQYGYADSGVYAGGLK